MFYAFLCVVCIICVCNNFFLGSVYMYDVCCVCYKRDQNRLDGFYSKVNIDD